MGAVCCVANNEPAGQMDLVDAVSGEGLAKADVENETMPEKLQQAYPDVSKAPLSVADALVGWYDFEWSEGKFNVCFRPGGHFFCPDYQSSAKWTLDGDNLYIKWGKFGSYKMKFDSLSRTMEGIEDKEAADPAQDWRKATLREELSAVEKLLFGVGAGTEWTFQWTEESFEVKFKADGYNHFSCAKYPAHIHWSLAGDDLTINWGSLGTYKLKVDPQTKTMSGALVGAADPPADTEWRKASYIRDNTDMNAVEACTAH